MAYQETFLCTAVPKSISGSKVRIAVLISLRLRSDGTDPAGLANWPDAQHWPSIAPTWQVVLTQGATTTDPLTAQEIVPTGGYDQASFAQMFPPDAPVTPYQPDDRSTHPVISYPVGTVRDAVKALHVKTMTHDRADFPATDALIADPLFTPFIAAADPGTSLLAVYNAKAAPRPDSEFTLAEALGVLDGMHGVRPLSVATPAPPPGPGLPVITKIDPFFGTYHGGTFVTITGENFTADAAVQFHIFGRDFDITSTVQPPDTITLTTPALGPGQYTVTVTTAAGTSDVTDKTIFIFINDNPGPH